MNHNGDCKCTCRVRLSDGSYQCADCGETFRSNGHGKPVSAPPGWRGYDRDERVLWYAREVIGARL